MGNSESKASEYVKMQWVADDAQPCCFNCGKEFSLTRRRHHCRCCGQVFDEDCWGVEVMLPEQYGYDERQPVCKACEEMVVGSLRLLRYPRRVVLTRALRTNKGAAQPPLSRANRAERSFEVFFMKVAHWRPLGSKSHLQFSVTFRTAAGVSSSAAISEQKAQWLREKELREKRSGVVDFAADDSNNSPVPSYASSADFMSGRNSRDSSQASVVARSVGPPIGVQLDIAWVLPLDAILQVVMDHHHESDYITIETAQETYRLQVADIHVRSDRRGGHDVGGDEGGGDDDGDSGHSGDEEDDGQSTAGPTVSTAGTCSTHTSHNRRSTSPPLPPDAHQSAPRPCMRGGGGSAAGAKAKKHATVICGPSRGHIDEAASEITSQPVVDAEYSVNVAGTADMLRELQALASIVGSRERARKKSSSKK